jgi:hypothetical protein
LICLDPLRRATLARHKTSNKSASPPITYNAFHTILNAISCLTNILFYDIPNRELLSNDIRINIFNSIKLYILATQNEEIQIETVRVLSNLSRHALLCDEFVSDSTYLEALSIVLDHTLRDLVFYSVGIIINISLHQETRHKVLER